MNAMQGRVLDGKALTGWKKRQPARDESSSVKTATERKREQRQRLRDAGENRDSNNECVTTEDVTKCHEMSRDVTLSHEESRDVTNDVTDSVTQDVAHKPPVNGHAIAFATFLDRCKTAGEKPISEYQPVWVFADKIGLPEDLVVLCWQEFVRRYGKGGTDETKRYRDWRKAFRKCVEGNWFGLWSLDEQGRVVVTTRGRIADKVNADA
jgi:hypothetical protein